MPHTEEQFNEAFKSYRPKGWTDAQFQAAVDQAADNNCNCEAEVGTEQWDYEFFCHLADIIEGRIENSYWNGN